MHITAILKLIVFSSSSHSNNAQDSNVLAEKENQLNLKVRKQGRSKKVPGFFPSTNFVW